MDVAYPEKPSSMGTVRVEHNACGNGEYASRLICLADYKTGQCIASFKDTATPTPVKRYSSVQVGCNEHVELNSDFVYLNHSCSPNVAVDTEQWCFVAYRDISAGDELTFFYPSTEWEMAQPFECWCGSPHCLKQVQGARFLSAQQAKKYPQAKHIQLLREQISAQNS